MSRVDRTNCEEAFRRLDDFLDRRLTPDEMRIIEKHLEVCAWCTREFNFEASVLHGVKGKLRQLEAPADLVTKILSQLPPTPEAQS
ncbi:MAG TPA: zf-HC2 domain-containing protein [Gemmatimonadales bacterium]|nr:zf-HC2 domain-containing protein [Gemmatimonadales bacterium]